MSGLLAILNATDEEFYALMEAIDCSSFSLDDFTKKMQEAGHPVSEMKDSMMSLTGR